MVSAPVSGLSCHGSSPGWVHGHCVSKKLEISAVLMGHLTQMQILLLPFTLQRTKSKERSKHCRAY